MRFGLRSAPERKRQTVNRGAVPAHNRYYTGRKLPNAVSILTTITEGLSLPMFQLQGDVRDIIGYVYVCRTVVCASLKTKDSNRCFGSELS